MTALHRNPASRGSIAVLMSRFDNNTKPFDQFFEGIVVNKLDWIGCLLNGLRCCADYGLKGRSQLFIKPCTAPHE